MEPKRAQRLTSAWSRDISSDAWPWPTVTDFEQALYKAREAMKQQLVDFVPDDFESGAIAKHDGLPVVVALIGDAVLVAGVQVDTPEHMPLAVARGEVRWIALDRGTARIHVESSYRRNMGSQWRTSRWSFAFGDDEPIEIVSGLSEDDALGEADTLARAIAGRLGWSVPEGPD